MPDLKLIIENCLKGDKRAQKAFYDQFSGWILGICFRYSKNRTEADDIFQEAFIKIFQNLGSLEKINSIEAWIKKVTINTCINFYKKRRELEFEISNMEVELQDFDSSSLSKLTVMELMGLIQALPDSQRVVFNMHVNDGFDFKDIATELNVAESTIRSNFYKARQKLANTLNKQKENYEKVRFR